MRWEGRHRRNMVEVRDVMEYFGEFLNEEEAEVVIGKVSGRSYFARMNGIRYVLMGRGHSIPFRAIYNRAKEIL